MKKTFSTRFLVNNSQLTFYGLKHNLTKDEPRCFYSDQRETDGRNDFFHKRRQVKKKLSCLSEKDKNTFGYSWEPLNLSSFLKRHVNLLTTRWHLCTAFETYLWKKGYLWCGQGRSGGFALMQPTSSPTQRQEGCRREGLNLFCAFLT